MKLLRLCLVSFAVSALALAGDGSNRNSSGANGGTVPAVAPVLRDPEPSDNVFVTLPGAPAPRSAAASPKPAVPSSVAKAVASPATAELPLVTLDDPGRPILKRASKPAYPPEFDRDSAVYCQKLIGQWSLEDAGMLLGEAHGARPAYDDSHKENGTIYAFPDPTGHYRQLELDFDSQNGTLRTVFGYPWNMSWQECRRLWGTNVSAAEAAKGRKFYSYVNRRMDVLVDPAGKVISFGLY